MSFWLKFVRDSDLAVSNSTMLKYSMALADRFSTVDDLLSADNHDLIQLGITNQADRDRLIRQAHTLETQVISHVQLVHHDGRIEFRPIHRPFSNDDQQ